MVPSHASRGSVFARAIAIILRPEPTWRDIALEDTTTSAIFWDYALPLAVIAPLCGFIGRRLFGTMVHGQFGQPDVLRQLAGAAIALCLMLISYSVLCAIAEALASRFGGNTGSIAATKLIAYSLTPVWLAGIFSLIPGLHIFSLFGLYSVFLAYKGVVPVLGVPADRTASCTLALVLSGLILNAAVYVLTATNLAFLYEMGLIG